MEKFKMPRFENAQLRASANYIEWGMDDDTYLRTSHAENESLSSSRDFEINKRRQSTNPFDVYYADLLEIEKKASIEMFDTESYDHMASRQMLLGEDKGRRLKNFINRNRTVSSRTFDRIVKKIAIFEKTKGRFLTNNQSLNPNDFSQQQDYGWGNGFEEQTQFTPPQQNNGWGNGFEEQTQFTPPQQNNGWGNGFEEQTQFTPPQQNNGWGNGFEEQQNNASFHL